ncbi:perlucin-like protein [Mytilus trossulus]|uniref:perlucin-like protein n=1 Tax=Mytilus trossulus TaxID=6551 RepID=UPI00300473EC
MLQMKFACLLFTFVRAIDEQYTEPCLNDNDEALITSMRQTMLALNEQMQVLETNLKKKSTNGILQVNCPSGWKHYSGHCYYFNGDNMSWTSAKNVCNKKGGHLVKIDDSSESLWIIEVMKGSGLKSVWIGANDISREGSWVWESDRSTLTFSDWNKNQPDNGYGAEDCAHINMYSSNSYHWNDFPCSSRAGYICERV